MKKRLSDQECLLRCDSKADALKHGKTMLLVLLMILIQSTTSKADSNQVDFVSASAARDYFMSLNSENKNWRSGISSHGSTVNTSSITTTLWSDGTWSQEWSGYHRKICGTVYAIPESNFVVEKRFRYKDIGTIKDGMVVAVKISIQCTNSNVGKDVYRRVIRNYVESGVNVPASGRTGSGRIISFKKAVRERFGADSCYYLEKISVDGYVRVLALGCNIKKARADVIPQTFQ